MAEKLDPRQLVTFEELLRAICTSSMSSCDGRRYEDESAV
jgi:hypothetical protein